MLRYDRKLYSSEPLSHQGITLQLQSNARLLHWAGGGVVWNRPHAVWVTQAGRRRRIRIVDRTRRLQVLCWGLALLFLLLGLSSGQRTRS